MRHGGKARRRRDEERDDAAQERGAAADFDSVTVADICAAAPSGLEDAEALRVALHRLGEYVLTQRARLETFLRVAAASAERASPLVRLSDAERRLAEQLVQRRPQPSAPDWRTRLLVARAVAAHRIWLDDLVAGAEPDPLAHLDEVLAEL